MYNCSDRSHKWNEPQANLMGVSYHTYPSGPTYAVRAVAASQIVSLLHKRRLRFLGCGDDCSVGLWMAALSSSWLDDARCVARPLEHDDGHSKAPSPPPPPSIYLSQIFVRSFAYYQSTSRHRLCEPKCSNTSVSVRGDSGLGGRLGRTPDAVRAMYRLRADPLCKGSSAEGSAVKSRIDFTFASCYRLLPTGLLDASSCIRHPQQAPL